MTLSSRDELTEPDLRKLEGVTVLREPRFPGVVRVTLDRPHARNAINEAMRVSVTLVLDALAAEDGLKAVVLTANGSYFSAGNDVKELDWLGSTTAGRAEATFRSQNAWLDRVSAFPLPVFAVVQGGALGHAADLVARCDVVACADDAVFGWPEVRAGGVPHSVWPLRLNHAGVVRECFYTGRLLDAVEARAVGLVNHVIEPERLEEFTLALCADLCLLSPYALRASKATVRAATEVGAAQYLEHALLVNSLAHDGDHTSDYWDNAAELGPKEANRLLQVGGEPYWSRRW
jgi:enoyl-CoA hydratase/carnithine racemase